MIVVVEKKTIVRGTIRNGAHTVVINSRTKGSPGTDATVTEAAVKSALGITVLEGDNTGDQDLSGYATKTGAETLTNKTLSTPTVNGYNEGNVSATAGSAYTVNIATSTIFVLTLNSATCTFTFPSVTMGKSFVLVLIQDATGGLAVTWPSTVDFGGTNPTLSVANKCDIISFIATGTKWQGVVVAQGRTA